AESSRFRCNRTPDRRRSYDPRNRRISIVVFEQPPSLADAPEPPPNPQHDPNPDPGEKERIMLAKPQSTESSPIDPVQQYLFKQ
ncbi:MAG TPA: hypothetical protein PKV86_09250, partial [Syntrophobacteraceae bacterium]|nr:hypothetical protein [Syntrophobacteraceae bacterium]